MVQISLQNFGGKVVGGSMETPPPPTPWAPNGCESTLVTFKWPRYFHTREKS